MAVKFSDEKQRLIARRKMTFFKPDDCLSLIGLFLALFKWDC